MTITDPARLGTILSVWAHPDDETYLAGGVMAAAAANGQRVVCVSATAGERGTDDPAGWPPERLGPIRRSEAAAALAVLGVGEHHWLDFEDGGLAELDPAEPVRRLAALIDNVRPDTILTFGPDGATFHPDHITVGNWTADGWQRAGRPGDLLCAIATDEHQDDWGALFADLGVYMTDQRPSGLPADDVDVHLVLDGAELERKVIALAAMPSQTAPFIDAVGVEVYRAVVATEAFVERARFPEITRSGIGQGSPSGVEHTLRPDLPRAYEPQR